MSAVFERVPADLIREWLTHVKPEDRNTWRDVGMAVQSELEETGFDLWDQWSQGGSTYNAKDAKTAWKSFKADGGITIGTLFYLAKKGGWQPNGTYQPPSPEALAARQRVAEERAKEAEAEIAKERQRAAEWAKEIWGKARAPRPDHPYLTRKQITPTSSIRAMDTTELARILGYTPKSSDEPLTGSVLVVLVKQGDQLSTLELIDEEGRKAALAGRGTKAGGYWAAQSLSEDLETLLIGEGVATVLSAREATGHPVVAALSSGNLEAVARIMQERHPKAEIVVLADLVKATGEPDSHAVDAARAVGGKVAVPDFGDGREAGQKDFNDMHCLLGLEAVARAIEAAEAPEAAQGGGGGWPEPQPLSAKVAPEDYPLDALPETLRAAVEEVQRFIKAPIPLVASSALAALSLAAQAHVDVKRAEKLQGPSGLFLLTIADSGERKSTCDGFFSSPIREYQEEQAEALKPDIQRYAADLDAWEAERDGMLAAIREAGKKNKSTGELKEDLDHHETLKPQPPRVPRMLLGDETPENLAWSLARQWPSAGVVSSEAGAIFGAHGMGKESIMRNLALQNVLWDGGAHSVGRRSSESFTVKGARLTVALQVQEATLREFFEKSGTLARGTGFLARFLIAWPESTQGYRPFTEAPETWPRLAAFHQRIAGILNNPVPMDDEGTLTPTLLPLAPEAKAVWVAFHDTIEGELKSGGDLCDVRDVASKVADNAVRLAALFHVFEHGLGGAIGLESFDGASRIAAWHLSESRRFFGELVAPVELVDAVKLDSWLIRHCQQEGGCVVGKNHARQHGPLRDRKRLDAALSELVELDRLRLVQEGRKWEIHLNPALVEGAP